MADTTYLPDGPVKTGKYVPVQKGDDWTMDDRDIPGYVEFQQFLPAEKQASYVVYVINSDGELGCAMWYSLSVELPADGEPVVTFGLNAMPLPEKFYSNPGGF